MCQEAVRSHLPPLIWNISIGFCLLLFSKMFLCFCVCVWMGVGSLGVKMSRCMYVLEVLCSVFVRVSVCCVPRCVRVCVWV